MITFLLWNLNKKPLTERIARLAERHDIDILILLECEIPTPQFLETVNARTSSIYEPTRSPLCDTITIYARFFSEFVVPFQEGPRYTIRKLVLPARPDLLLATIHLPSRLYFDSQNEECSNFADVIKEQEQISGHSRTIVVGDFNLNPFESGIIGANRLHGVMTRETAARGHRTVQGVKYPFFYNPMWGHFGDGKEGPPGTYYHGSR